MKNKVVDQVISELSENIREALGSNLVGFYLFGSLTYGGFNEQSSDIDLMAILKEPATPSQLELLKKIHSDSVTRYPNWATRVECSYTPISMLSSLRPPTEPRPYYGENTFWPEAPYGNEWIINLHLTYEYGQTLIGPDFKTLIQPINIMEVQKAAIKDLFQDCLSRVARTHRNSPKLALWFGNERARKSLRFS